MASFVREVSYTEYLIVHDHNEDWYFVVDSCKRQTDAVALAQEWQKRNPDVKYHVMEHVGEYKFI